MFSPFFPIFVNRLVARCGSVSPLAAASLLPTSRTFVRPGLCLGWGRAARLPSARGAWGGDVETHQSPPVPAVWRATVPSWVTPVAFPSAEQIWVRALSPDSGGRAPCQGVQVGLVLWPLEPPLVGAAGWRSPAGGAPTASQRAPSTPAPPTACGKAPSGEPWLTPLVLVTRSHSVRDLIPSDLEARARPTEVHANFFFVEAELIQDQASELPHLEEKGKGARFLQALRHPSPCRQLRWGQETSWSYCGWHLKALR